jgi:hypothetical protein
MNKTKTKTKTNPLCHGIRSCGRMSTESPHTGRHGLSFVLKSSPRHV